MGPPRGGRSGQKLGAWVGVSLVLVLLQGCGRIWFEELGLPLDASADGPGPDGSLDAPADSPSPDASSQDADASAVDAGDSSASEAGMDAGSDAGTVTASNADTYIEGLVSTPQGSAIDLKVGRAQGGNLIYTLASFDLSAIPSNAIVLSAKMRLYQFESNSSGTLSIGAHQILQAWSEASATFTNADSVTTWSSQGGTYASTAAATTSVPIGTFGWYEWDLTALVQQWVNGSAANYGVELTMGTVNQGQWVGFASRENTAATEHPQLVVTTQ